MIDDNIIRKIERGFEKYKFDYTGILFIGLMICNSIPYVLEFNVRFGDPETEVVLPRLKY
jgi:Phosphoribosylamine-glycine ligase